MKSLQWMVLSVFVGVALFPNAAVWAKAGEVSAVVGAVAIDGKMAAAGQTFESGITVTTGAGAHTVLRFEDGQVVAVGQRSEFKVGDYRYDPAEVSQSRSFLSLARGAFRAITGVIGSNNRAAVRYAAAGATIGIRGTEILVSVVGDTTYISAATGAIEVTTTAGQVVTLAAGETVAISAAGQVIATGAAATQAAAQAGAFAQLNTINMAVGAAAGVAAAPAAAAGAVTAGAVAGVAAIVGIAAVAAGDSDGTTATTATTATAP